jgi:hypothetical protein
MSYEKYVLRVEFFVKLLDQYFRYIDWYLSDPLIEKNVQIVISTATYGPLNTHSFFCIWKQYKNKSGGSKAFWR